MSLSYTVSPGLFIRIEGRNSLRTAGRELWRHTGTKLKYSSAYHPQTQGVVERMNAVVSQTLRCLIHNTNEMKKWEILLPTVKLVINSLPNSSTSFSPFFLNYRYEPVTPIQLLRGDEIARTESVASFRTTGCIRLEPSQTKSGEVSTICSKNIMIRNTGMWDIE